MVRLQRSGEALEVECVACTAVNRVPVGRLTTTPRCGRCGDELSVDQPFAVSDATFQHLVGQAAVPVLVDAWAPWCGPCRSVASELVKVAANRANQLLVAKINSDENPVFSNSFDIRSIPSLLLFVDGNEVRRQVGAMPAPDILGWITERTCG